MTDHVRRILFDVTLAACLLAQARIACAIDISGVQYAALDQPVVNAYVATRAGGPPLVAYGVTGGTSFTIQPYLDTGACGIMLSDDTFNNLSHPINTPPETGLVKSRFPANTGPLVVFQNVGVSGSDSFNVSQPIYLGVAKNSASVDLDNFQTYTQVYNQVFGPIRAQIGLPPSDPLSEFDVIGMPGMQGKVVVMDPKPLDAYATSGDPNTFAAMQTYLYNRRTPFNAATAASEPGIPPTNRHIRLSYANMSRFTQVTPSGAAGPALNDIPFIGPNPVGQMDGVSGDNTPGVTVSFDGQQTTGSFLFDTGSATSMISTLQAAKLQVRYIAGTQGTSNPELETFDPAHPSLPGTPIANQFQLQLSSAGGTATASAGFYLDSMFLRTLEGDPGNATDPNNLRFLGAPVLVSDVTVKNPLTQQTLTLDGVLGVNNWVASAAINSQGVLTNLSASGFNWAVFDQPNGVLGLDVKPAYVGTAVTTFSSWSASGSAAPNWSSSANWETGTPAIGNGLRFTQSSGGSTANFNDFPSGTRFNGIVFSGPSAFNLHGNSIALWGNVINSGTTAQTISLDMELNGAASTFDAYSGDILDTGRISGNQGVVKTGGYRLIVTGSNTYSGSTAINEGELLVNGSLVGPVSVNSGVLGGTGSLTSAIVSSGGTLSPGNLLGQLQLSGSLTLLSGAVMDYELGTPLDSSLVYMPSGALNLNGQQFSDFNFTSLADFAPGEYTLIDAGSISGNLGANTSGTIDGLQASLAVHGNNLVLNVVPEPGTLALLGISAIGLMRFPRHWRPRGLQLGAHSR